ncbi:MULTISPECIES: PadR family transcriptional regulator [Carnobacterium]|uniref:PadR family transcriptional regulator n=1 Tax=unclassified Carnobacterium TaxID=257487 RepID=UPI00073A8FA2|nr:Transcriptional regulator, PadR [Carnobacterium sp. CP1]
MNNKKLKHSYIPMTETAFYILLSLVTPKHGYAIIDYVEKLTKKRISLGPGTIYGTLSKMKNDGLIEPVKEESNRKIYQITPLGKEILDSEKARIEELYLNSKGGL